MLNFYGSEYDFEAVFQQRSPDLNEALPQRYFNELIAGEQDSGLMSTV